MGQLQKNYAICSEAQFLLKSRRMWSNPRRADWVMWLWRVQRSASLGPNEHGNNQTKGIQTYSTRISASTSLLSPSLSPVCRRVKQAQSLARRRIDLYTFPSQNHNYAFSSVLPFCFCFFLFFKPLESLNNSIPPLVHQSFSVLSLFCMIKVKLCFGAKINANFWNKRFANLYFLGKML